MITIRELSTRHTISYKDAKRTYQFLVSKVMVCHLPKTDNDGTCRMSAVIVANKWDIMQTHQNAPTTIKTQTEAINHVKPIVMEHHKVETE